MHCCSPPWGSPQYSERKIQRCAADHPPILVPPEGVCPCARAVAKRFSGGDATLAMESSTSCAKNYYSQYITASRYDTPCRLVGRGKATGKLSSALTRDGWCAQPPVRSARDSVRPIAPDLRHRLELEKREREQWGRARKQLLLEFW